MEVQPSDDVEKYAGSDIISRAETRDGRGSGLASAGEVWVDDEKKPTRFQGLVSYFTNRRYFPDGGREILKIRSLQDYALGYPNLAVFKSSSDDYAVYRRFGYLQSRLLLDKQDDLRILEQKLEEYDRANVSDNITRALGEDVLSPRTALLAEVERAFNAHATLLDSAQKLLAASRPSESDYRSVRNYIEANNPLHDSEQEYIHHKQDLITLRPGRDYAWLDRAIDRALRLLHKPFPFVNRIFCSPEDALKSRSPHEVYYTQSRIDLCAGSLITLTIAGLLIIPIYLLYTLAKNSQGAAGLDRHATAVCIAILLVCTLSFSGVLSLFTRAKRHEVLGAAAAYCAVLVVFMGTMPD